MADATTTAESLRWAVSRLSTRLRAEQQARQGTSTLTRLAASILANLRHGGAATATGLAEAEGLQPQSLTRTLGALEDEGRIRRAPDESDRRAQRIEITDAGRGALDEHVAAGNAWLARAIEHGLTPAERAVLDIAAELMMPLCAYDEPLGRAQPGAGDLAAAPL